MGNAPVQIAIIIATIKAVAVIRPKTLAARLFSVNQQKYIVRNVPQIPNDKNIFNR